MYTQSNLHNVQMEHPDWQGDTLPSNWFSWRSLWAFTGPGALMSIAYIDPGELNPCAFSLTSFPITQGYHEHARTRPWYAGVANFKLQCLH